MIFKQMSTPLNKYTKKTFNPNQNNHVCLKKPAKDSLRGNLHDLY